MATDARSSEQAPIGFTAALSTIDDATLGGLPGDVSERLPSRRQGAAHASIGGRDFETVVEPDGRRGHWIRGDEGLQRGAGGRPGGTAARPPPGAPQGPGA